MDDEGKKPSDADPEEDVVTCYAKAPFELEEVQRMLKADPKNETLLDIAAFKHYTSGVYEKALEYYNALVKIDSMNASYQFHLGNTCYKLGLHQQALDAWKEAHRLSPMSRIGKKAMHRIQALVPTLGS